MCNRVVQDGRVIKPGEKARVLMKGPGAVFELPFNDAVFGGPAKSESRSYWIRREGAEPVIVPDIPFGEKNKTTGEQGMEVCPRDRAGRAIAPPTRELAAKASSHSPRQRIRWPGWGMMVLPVVVNAAA